LKNRREKWSPPGEKGGKGAGLYKGRLNLHLIKGTGFFGKLKKRVNRNHRLRKNRTWMPKGGKGGGKRTEKRIMDRKDQYLGKTCNRTSPSRRDAYLLGGGWRTDPRKPTSAPQKHQRRSLGRGERRSPNYFKTLVRYLDRQLRNQLSGGSASQ